MRKFCQLTREQRYQIAALLSTGMTKADIADQIGVHPSTIYRELARNSGSRGYRAKQAHRRTQQRRRDKGADQRKIKGELQELVEAKLRMGWSPEQISGRLRLEKRTYVSYETIYQHILRDSKCKGDLRYCLRHRGYGYRRFRKSRHERLSRPQRRHIHERPQDASDRKQRGHWERDLVEAQRGGPALLTIVDRKTRYAKIEWIENRTMREVNDATIAALKPFAKINRTLTNDNGSEFNQPNQVEQAIGAKVYYTEPSSPWQRGAVENLAGLTRQYFRKRIDWNQEHEWIAGALEETLNFRPRKSLRFRTPHEEFFRDRLLLLEGELMHFGLKFSATS